MDQKSRPTSILKVTIKLTNQANTKHLYRPNICTTSAQRIRRWANTVQMLSYANVSCLLGTTHHQNVLIVWKM